MVLLNNWHGESIIRIPYPAIDRSKLELLVSTLLSITGSCDSSNEFVHGMAYRFYSDVNELAYMLSLVA